VFYWPATSTRTEPAQLTWPVDQWRLGWVYGEDLLALPLEERRARLLNLLEHASPEGICFSEHHDGDGEALYRAACSTGLEGIVAKRKGSRYASGRSKAWLKINNLEFQRRG